MFAKISLNFNHDIFTELLNSTKLENITKGRKGGNIANIKDDIIPIVRTTTSYKREVQPFEPIHYNIIENIKNNSQLKDLELNNAMVELYDPSYSKMKYHSDQALDLVDESYICIYSCYMNPCVDKDIRTLETKEKSSDNTTSFLLDNNSVIIFSTDTNKKYLHKIILNNANSSNYWLGVTFRLSKTYVKKINDVFYFYPSHKLLRSASEDEKKEFFKYKKLENDNIDYLYPSIEYIL